jgi:hypothetical protein
LQGGFGRLRERLATSGGGQHGQYGKGTEKPSTHRASFSAHARGEATFGLRGTAACLHPIKARKGVETENGSDPYVFGRLRPHRPFSLFDGTFDPEDLWTDGLRL